MESWGVWIKYRVILQRQAPTSMQKLFIGTFTKNKKMTNISYRLHITHSVTYKHFFLLTWNILYFLVPNVHQILLLFIIKYVHAFFIWIIIDKMVYLFMPRQKERMSLDLIGGIILGLYYIIPASRWNECWSLTWISCIAL